LNAVFIKNKAFQFHAATDNVISVLGRTKELRGFSLLFIQQQKFILL
jgi:hypothetical protein